MRDVLLHALVAQLLGECREPERVTARAAGDERVDAVLLELLDEERVLRRDVAGGVGRERVGIDDVDVLRLQEVDDVRLDEVLRRW